MLVDWDWDVICITTGHANQNESSFRVSDISPSVGLGFLSPGRTEQTTRQDTDRRRKAKRMFHFSLWTIIVAYSPPSLSIQLYSTPYENKWTRLFHSLHRHVTVGIREIWRAVQERRQSWNQKEIAQQQKKNMFFFSPSYEPDLISWRASGWLHGVGWMGLDCSPLIFIRYSCKEVTFCVVTRTRKSVRVRRNV